METQGISPSSKPQKMAHRQVDASILASLELFICVGENAEANN